MSDSWMQSIESLVERWRADVEPVQLATAAEFEIPPDAEDRTATTVVDLRPALAELSRDGRQALSELAEAIRGAMAGLADALRAEREGVPSAAPVAAGDAAGETRELVDQVAALRADFQAALERLASVSAADSAPPAPTSQEVAGDVERVAADLKSLLEQTAEEGRSGRKEHLDAIRSALAEFSEEDMVGRAGLAKSLKIGMADLAEKNRRAVEELRKALDRSAGGQGDTVSFHPDPIAAQAFETTGGVGAFPQFLEEGASRQIAVNDCYAAQVNDDSMAPLACEGHTLLVSRSLPAKNGDLVIAQLSDGRWVFKRFVLRGEQHQLQSVNAQLGLPAIVLTEPPAQIHVVVGVIFGRALARSPQEAGASSATVGHGG